jgi:2-oxoglutarate dehydrogenase E2 component (dihydrolipoamide succinyltransferase)
VSNVVEIRAPVEQTEGTRSQVLRWLKSIGDRVEASEPLVELETDKVTIEIPAPTTGFLQKILKGERQDVGPGELLGELDIGVEPAQEITAVAAVAATPAPSRAAPANGAGRLRLSPAVRRLLKEHQLDAGDIAGTGRDGRITAQDVQRHLGTTATGAEPPVAASAPVTAAPGRQARASDHDDVPGVRRVPHTAMRQRVAEHMVRSLLHTAPHVTTVFDADLSAVLAHRAHHRATFERQGVGLTLTAYFVAAAVAAIRAVPEANARWTDTAVEISEQINIGIATALESEGLIVPVLREAQTLNLLGIARGLTTLVGKARDRALTPADVQGGTFTISNHGVSGSLIATPIVINQPQSAILGVGRMEKRVVVREIDGDDHMLIRPMCYVTLTIDHRVMDGFTANRFLQVFTHQLERWPLDP